jgi:sugar O-acyltransferase (sialic acid O-acetyltransferase NeuD family)
MQRVIVFGAGGHGRGTLEILRARIAAGLPTPMPMAFADDDETHHGRELGGLRVEGGSAWVLEQVGPDVGVILALASTKAKRAVADKLAAASTRYASAVHPGVILGTGTTVADGAIVNAGVVTAYDARIESHTTVNLNATIGHDCVVGTYATVAPGVNVAGNVTIGDGAEVQTNATLVPGVRIGAWASVGPGSVVLRDVADGALVFGNPAKSMPRLGGAAS